MSAAQPVGIRRFSRSRKMPGCFIPPVGHPPYDLGQIRGSTSVPGRCEQAVCANDRVGGLPPRPERWSDANWANVGRPVDGRLRRCSRERSATMVESLIGCRRERRRGGGRWGPCLLRNLELWQSESRFRPGKRGIGSTGSVPGPVTVPQPHPSPSLSVHSNAPIATTRISSAPLLPQRQGESAHIGGSLPAGLPWGGTRLAAVALPRSKGL